MKQINDGQGPEKNGKSGPSIEKLLEFARGHAQAIAVVLVLACVVIYAVATATGGKSPTENVPDPGSTAAVGDVQEPGSQASGTGSSKQDPFNGLDIYPDDPVSDGFEVSDSYWCITPRTREKWHMLQVPYGWSAQPVTGGIRVKPEGFSETTTGAEPVTFWWDVPVCFDALQAQGSYDVLSVRQSEDYVTDLYYVVDYYLHDDCLGDEWPVYVIRHVREASPSSEYAEGLDEYAFFVAKPYPNGDTSLYFVGTVDGGSFAAMSTPRFQTVESLVREIFPPSSDPGYPESWNPAAADGNEAGKPDSEEPGEESDAPDDEAGEPGTEQPEDET